MHKELEELEERKKSAVLEQNDHLNKMIPFFSLSSVFFLSSA